jgi:hypothetical protein
MFLKHVIPQITTPFPEQRAFKPLSMGRSSDIGLQERRFDRLIDFIAKSIGIFSGRKGQRR